MTLRDSDILNLPDAPDFISEPPAYSLAEMIQLCEKMLPYWNALRYSKPEPPFVGEAFSLADPPSENEPPAS
jgi:hypothetical protein